MKILYVYDFYLPHVGGGEIALQHLAEGMASLGHTVDVVTSKLPGTISEETVNGIHIHRVWVPKFASRYWFMLLSLRSIFIQAKTADLMHTFTYTAVPPAWIVAKLRRKKLVLTVHEYWGKLWKSFSGLGPVSASLHCWFERALFFLPMTRWITISHATEKNLRGLRLPQAKLSVIYQGIDEELFKRPAQIDIDTVRKQMRVADQTFIYLFFGRPGISKGLEFLLRAVPEISNRIPDSQLWLLLAKEPKDQYERMIQLIQDLDIQSHLQLIEPVERKELPLYLAAAQAIIVPSLSEGFGFSVAEACAVGTPVVASNVGSIPEVISGKYILVDPANPLAIAQGVVNIQTGTFSQTPRKPFSWDDTVSKHLALYKKVSGVPR